MNGMLETALCAGINIIPKHKAAKLLALCYYYGDEPFVFNKELYGAAMIASKTFGFEGGKIPDQEVARQFKKRMSEITDGKANWVEDIEKEYGVRFPG